MAKVADVGGTAPSILGGDEWQPTQTFLRKVLTQEARVLGVLAGSGLALGVAASSARCKDLHPQLARCGAVYRRMAARASLSPDA